MSAYGTIAAPSSSAELSVHTWPLVNGLTLTTYPVRGANAPRALIDYLHKVFNDELEGRPISYCNDGKTYPQEGPLDYDAFAGYFFGAATIIGIVNEGEGKTSLEEAIDGQKLEEVVGGCYYIKPNYPGRSSHLCNGGFLVPTTQRGRKIGGALAKSFLEYAPKLGYRGSVFNLVFKNNVASLRLWDQLGFTRVGIIPGAGRLKSGPNGEEEYVDAVVIHKSFV